MRKQAMTFAITALALLIYPLSLSSQNSFSMSLDANGASGDQAVTSRNASPDQVVSIQIFGTNIQNTRSLSARFEYDESQIVYEGFDAGDVLPDALVFPEHGLNPTFVEIGMGALGGESTVSSGLVGTVRFRTTAAFSGTAIRLVRGVIGRGGQLETVTLTARIELQSGSGAAAPSPDFNGDGIVDVNDFSAFANFYGTQRGDGTYQAKYDLDSNDVIGISDLIIFMENYGNQVPTSGGDGSGGSGGGNTFDGTVAQIKNLEDQLEQNRNSIEQEITTQRENHPLNAPKDQFESDAEYAARQSQLDSILAESRQRLLTHYDIKNTQTQIAQLYRKTFPTNDITVTLGEYNANAGYFPVTVETTLNGESRRYDGGLTLNRDDARSLYNNWDRVIKTGYLSIDPGYRQALAWVKLEYTPIWPQGFWWALNEVYHLGDNNLSIAFSPDGNYLATASQNDRMATLWDMSSGQRIQQMEHGPRSVDYVYTVAFSPDGQYLATGGRGGRYTSSGETVLWDLNSGRKVREIGQDRIVHAVAFSPDGKYLAITTHPYTRGGETVLWDLNSGRKVREMEYRASSTTIHAVAFSPDGQYLATGNLHKYTSSLDGVTVWEVSSGKVVQQIEHTGAVHAVAFSPDGQYLATGGYLRRGSNRGAVTLWEVTDGQKQEVGQSVLQMEHIDDINAVAFSPDGQYLAVGGEDRTITFYRIPTEEITITTEIAIEKIIRTSSEVIDLAWNPDGRFISDGRRVYRVIPRPDIEAD